MIAHGLRSLRDAVRQNPGLRVALWFHAALLLIALADLCVDRRLILGLWPAIKPLKFDISTIIYLATLALLLAALGDNADKWRRSRLWLGWGFALCMMVENAIITLQALRGVRSHMNYTTTGNALLFAAMGQFIALNTLLAAWLLVLWLLARTDRARAVVWGIRLGLVMLLAASAEGVRIVMNNGHTVAAPDGGPGLPFLNWSTLHGDLRVAHFLGLHGLQLLPIAGLLLARTRLSEKAQVAAICAIATVYLCVDVWLFRSAMHGTPLVRL